MSFLRSVATFVALPCMVEGLDARKSAPPSPLAPFFPEYLLLSLPGLSLDGLQIYIKISILAPRHLSRPTYRGISFPSRCST